MINVTQYPQDKRDFEAAKDFVRSACGPLLEVLPGETVSVVHHSLIEFLNGSTRDTKSHDYPVLEFGSTHNCLTLVCLSYLQSACVDELVIIQILLGHRVTYRRPRQLLPVFTEYAASDWPIHLRKAALAGVDQTEVNSFLDKFLTADNFRELPMRDLGRNPTPLFATAKLGLTAYTRTLLSRQGTDVNKVNRVEDSEMGVLLYIEGESPLCHAARKNYDEIVDLLLQHNADEKNSTDGASLRCITQQATITRKSSLSFLKLVLILSSHPSHDSTMAVLSRPLCLPDTLLTRIPLVHTSGQNCQ
jgi:hypothetical protein